MNVKLQQFKKKPSLNVMAWQEKGLALIAALALIAILGLVSTVTVYTTNTDIKISNNYRTSTQAFYMAEAGIHDALGRLMNGSISDSGAKLDPNWNDTSVYSSAGLNNSFTVKHYVIGGSMVTDDSGTPLFLINSTGASSTSTKQVEAVVSLIYALPFTKAFELNSNNNYTLGISNQAKKYHFNNFRLRSNSHLDIYGKVTFYISGNFELSSNASITVNTGSSLTIYVTGTTYFNSNVIQNLGGGPLDFTIYSSATSSSSNDYKVDLDSNTDLFGTIYAPYAAIDLNSNSISSGAIRGKYITAGSNAKFHYDEALGRLDGYPVIGYKIISWHEIN